MSKEMIISSSPQETKVAILEEDQLVEIHIERSQEQGLVGSIHKGRVTKVLPGMQSAFVNIGLDRDAFLYVSDFFEDTEEYDSLVATVEDKIEKLGSSHGQIPTPAVIEIPTLPEIPGSPLSVRLPSSGAAPGSLPSIAEAAVTTQPTPVSEKAAEAKGIEEPPAAFGSQGSGANAGASKPRNESDRQSRGRYVRRRGRRRPWERRRDEAQHAQPPASPATPSGERPSGERPPGEGRLLAPPAPHVVSALTPLPGESLSKSQSMAPLAGVQTEPKPEEKEEITLQPPGTIPTDEVHQKLQFAKEATSLQPDSVEAPSADSPLDLLGLGIPGDVPAGVVEAEAPISVSILDSADTPSEFNPVTPGHTEIQAEVATPSEEFALSQAGVSEPPVQPLMATALTGVEATPPELAAASSEIVLSPEKGPEDTARASRYVLPAASAFVRVGEAVPEPTGVTFAEPPAMKAEAMASQSGWVASLQADSKATTREEISSTAVKPFELPKSKEPILTQGPVGEAAQLIVAALPSTEAKPPISSAPWVGAEVVSLGVETPVSNPAAGKKESAKPFLPAAVVSVSNPGQTSKRFERRPFEKDRFYKPKPEEKRYEPKGGAAPSPEVYGPPTPYEFMTDAEKAEYNAGRAREKTTAKILDSSRKLTAPHPREFGYRRGGRGRRGRKRFGDREPREESQAPAPREEKRGSGRPMIADLLREGQEILVQIAKEPLGKKGARITSHIALPGRYLVYMPTVDHIGVSRKVASDEERHRLKRIINENRVNLPGGFIVRTAGEGRSEEDLKQDIRFLASTWADIRTRAEKRPAPSVLHRDLGVLERILRDQLTSEYTAIRLDSETEYAKVLEFVNTFQPSLIGRVKLHLKDTPIFEEYGITHEIDKALKPKVWLKSGGYIVINQTEAMVAIDVNTGKFVGRTARLEDTIVKTNIDAAKEVARQIRLRDMGGIIVIDFIDMEERKNRQKVIQSLEDAMHEDRAPSKILAFNDFGLVALTRKRVKQSLEKTLLQPCSYCQGHGMIKSVQTLCYEIQAEAKKMASLLDGREIRIRVHPEVARALKTTEQGVVTEIESHTRKDVTIKADPGTHQDQFEIY